MKFTFRFSERRSRARLNDKTVKRNFAVGPIIDIPDDDIWDNLLSPESYGGLCESGYTFWTVTTQPVDIEHIFWPGRMFMKTFDDEWVP